MRGLRALPIERYFEIDTSVGAADAGIYYLHCSRCVDEQRELFADVTSPRDYARTQVSITASGLQVFCVRHNINVARLVLRPEVVLGMDREVERRVRSKADRKRAATRKRS
jgi:hypothetical protein